MVYLLRVTQNHKAEAKCIEYTSEKGPSEASRSTEPRETARDPEASTEETGLSF